MLGNVFMANTEAYVEFVGNHCYIGAFLPAVILI